MSDPYQYLSPQGVIVADTSDIQNEVINEWQQAFGADLVTTPDTPQGVMITAEALARDNIVRNNAAVANQINPNVAGGVFLDAIGLLTGITRAAQKPTVVTNVTLAGVPGTVIPVGAQASTAAGDIFQLVNAVTIPVGGNVLGIFNSVAFGPIPCADHALNIVTTGILGWESVDNNQAGTPASVTTLGTTTQSDQAFRAFRLNTLAFQGLALAEAITSALYAVANVESLSFRENYNSAPMGMIIPVTGGATLSGTVWTMSTLQGAGSGTNGNIIVGTDAINFTQNGQAPPPVTPWPTAAFTTTGNIALTGLGTQGGGDWGGALGGGEIILVKNQSVAAQNGLYVAASGAWARQGYAPTAAQLLGSNSGISMIANSIFSCIAGGSDTDVAAALLENKSSGCAWTGSTVVNIIEPASGQSYAVTFQRPAQIGILIEVTITGATEEQVVQAILDYQAGTVTDPSGNPSNLDGFNVGQNVSPFEIAGAIVTEIPGCYISNLEIAVNSMSPSFAAVPIAIGLNQQAFTQLSFITVNVG